MVPRSHQQAEHLLRLPWPRPGVLGSVYLHVATLESGWCAEACRTTSQLLDMSFHWNSHAHRAGAVWLLGHCRGGDCVALGRRPLLERTTSHLTGLLLPLAAVLPGVPHPPSFLYLFL